MAILPALSVMKKRNVNNAIKLQVDAQLVTQAMVWKNKVHVFSVRITRFLREVRVNAKNVVKIVPLAIP